MRFWIVCGALLAATPVMGGALNLTVMGCPVGVPIRVALYDNARGFSEVSDSRGALSMQELRASSDVVRFSFAELKPGEYAVAAFADRNGNQRLDANFIGLPTEPYGFSRDARNLFSAPNFEQATFEIPAGEIPEGGISQIIHLK